MFTDRALQPDDSRDGIFNYARYHDPAIRSSGEVGAVAYGAGVLKSCYMLLRLEGVLRRSASRLCAWVAAKALTECRAVAHLDIFPAPASFGRRRARAEKLPALIGIFGTALAHFGCYWFLGTRLLIVGSAGRNDAGCPTVLVYPRRVPLSGER